MNDTQLPRRSAAGEEGAFQELVSTNLGSTFDSEEHAIDDVRNTLGHDDHLPDGDLGKRGQIYHTGHILGNW
jgi:hypothetical protein